MNPSLLSFLKKFACLSVFVLFGSFSWVIFNQVSQLRTKVDSLIVSSVSEGDGAVGGVCLTQNNLVVDGPTQDTPPVSPIYSLQSLLKDSIVKVISYSQEFNLKEPYKTPKQQQGSGSGFFVSEEGYFITNYHVVGYSLQNKFQILCCGQEKLSCYVVGVCPDRDLALLKISQEAQEKIISKLGKIPVLQFGNSDAVKRGDKVVTMGFPLGKDTVVSTSGIVSGCEEIPLVIRGGTLSCFQIDAAINPGSSGGAVVNLLGEVVGVSFAGVAQAQNVGYLLPINELRPAIKKLYQERLLFQPSPGFNVQATNDTLCRYFNAPVENGLLVKLVFPGSSADKAGLKIHDVIVEIDGYPVDHHGDVLAPWREDRISLSNVLHRKEVGDVLKVTVIRNGKEHILFVPIENNINWMKVRDIYPGYEDVDYEVFGGLVLKNLSLNDVLEMISTNPRLARFTAPEKLATSSVVISYIQPSSEAISMAETVSVGSLIQSVNDKAVKNINDVRIAIAEALSKNDQFIKIVTDSNTIVVFDLKKVLNDELRLAGIFKYDKAHSLALEAVSE